MKEKIQYLVEELESIIPDVEKVEGHAYGYKSAAVRARKKLLELRNAMQDLRKEVQEKKVLD